MKGTWLDIPPPANHTPPQRQNMFDPDDDEIQVKKTMPRPRIQVAEENAAILTLLQKRIRPYDIYHTLLKEGYFISLDNNVMPLTTISPTITRLRKLHRIPMYQTKSELTRIYINAGIHIDDIKRVMGIDSKNFASHVRHAGYSILNIRSLYIKEKKMDLRTALKTVVEPGLKLLPKKMNTVEAEVMLLAIGMQESRFEYRKQINGPAKGFYQFEKNGGVKGVLNHNATRGYLQNLESPINPDELGTIYNQIETDDALATIMARLLLYTDPQPLPKLTCDPSESWNYYLRNWRPGKPHRETWDAYWMHALGTVRAISKNNVITKPVEPEVKKVKTWPGKADQRVVCAAIRHEFGAIICGPRHFDSTMHEQISNSTIKGWGLAEQGFVDQFGEFLTRKEALVIAKLAKQIFRNFDDDTGDELYSEHLY